MRKYPSAEFFSETVEKMIENYGIIDCIYNRCIEEFSQLRLSKLKAIHKIRILRPFLITWGAMQRWLGDAGVERIFQKLKEEAFATRIELLRHSDLQLAELEDLKGQIIGLFDELMETKFKSENKSAKIKIKNVNSTATSKVLHLCCPDLFIMWDTNIRTGYHKENGDGKDYFQFLIEMKDFLNALSDIIKELQEKYGLRPTRTLDMYNWAKYTGSKK